MKKWIAWTVVLLAVVMIAGWLDRGQRLPGWLAGDSFYRGLPARNWSWRLQSDDSTIVEDARLKLEQGGAASVPVLIELLGQKSAEDWSTAKVRWMAAETLGKIGVEARAAAGPLMAALNDLDVHVRAVAASSLPAVDAPAEPTVPALVAMMQKEPSVEPIRALSQYGPAASEAVAELIRLVGDEQLPSEVRWNAVRTLGKIRDAAAGAIPALVAQLQNSTPSIREHAAEALGDIGLAARDTAPALVPLLADIVPKVRRDAARSLGQIQAPRDVAGPPLQKLLQDPEEIVRSAAQTSLQTIAPDLLQSEPAVSLDAPTK